MEKTILILSGTSDGKTEFIRIIMEHKYWVWNINHLNRLSSLTYSLGWDGERNTRYYEFLKKFEALSIEYFNFKERYIQKLVDKFRTDEKTNVLIIHGIDQTTAVEMVETYGANHLFIGSGVHPAGYKVVLDCNDANFEDQVLETMAELIQENTIHKEGVEESASIIQD